MSNSKELKNEVSEFTESYMELFFTHIIDVREETGFDLFEHYYEADDSFWHLVEGDELKRYRSLAKQFCSKLDCPDCEPLESPNFGNESYYSESYYFYLDRAFQKIREQSAELSSEVPEKCAALSSEVDAEILRLALKEMPEFFVDNAAAEKSKTLAERLFVSILRAEGLSHLEKGFFIRNTSC